MIPNRTGEAVVTACVVKGMGAGAVGVTDIIGAELPVGTARRIGIAVFALGREVSDTALEQSAPVRFIRWTLTVP